MVDPAMKLFVGAQFGDKENATVWSPKSPDVDITWRKDAIYARSGGANGGDDNIFGRDLIEIKNTNGIGPLRILMDPALLI